MSSPGEFSTRVFGKWILAGEHAVLRGSPALVFPLKSKFLNFKFTPKNQDGLNLSLAGSFGEEYKLLFWGVLEKAFQLKKIKRTEINGDIHIACELPIGAGLGASATLCAAVTRWLMNLKYVSTEESLEFARQLENLFHGESSGVDVAVALSGQAIKYKRGETPATLETQTKPVWAISYCGRRGVTADCVSKVKSLFFNNSSLAEKLDEDMKQAVALCEKGLASEKNFNHLLEGINLAAQCFEHWGLTEGALDQHIKMLKDQGALAVKPTGSGNGGYVLSVWRDAFPENLKNILIDCGS